jgi:hypothetical protein
MRALTRSRQQRTEDAATISRNTALDASSLDLTWVFSTREVRYFVANLGVLKHIRDVLRLSLPCVLTNTYENNYLET